MDTIVPSLHAGPSDRAMPRLLIAATHSGAGKTSFTLGLLASLRKRGIKVQAFKAGPDYIDPALHSVLTSRPSRNLDTRLMSRRRVMEIFQRNAGWADLSLVEGVMGYFDEAEPGRRSGSSADLARMLSIPALVLIDVRGMSASAAATALGFLRYRRPSQIAGFLLNRIGSPRHYAMTRKAVEEATGLPVLGYLPKDEGLVLPERHLGLVGQFGDEGFWITTDRIRQAVDAHVDIDALLAIAHAAPEVPPVSSLLFFPEEAFSQRQGNAVRIAVARDEAFRFYYEDNLDLLKRFGAELVFFSPLHDRGFPGGIGGLYLGGGYPELYLQEIGSNDGMRRSVRDAAGAGMPIFAECGGLMYLLEEIVDSNGNKSPAAGVFRGRAVMNTQRRMLGYFNAVVAEDCLVAHKGRRLVGHCFHWSSIEGGDPRAHPAFLLSRNDSPPIADGICAGDVFASYLHLHFAACPDVARRFVTRCHRYARKPEYASA